MIKEHGHPAESIRDVNYNTGAYTSIPALFNLIILLVESVSVRNWGNISCILCCDQATTSVITDPLQSAKNMEGKQNMPSPFNENGILVLPDQL